MKTSLIQVRLWKSLLLFGILLCVFSIILQLREKEQQRIRNSLLSHNALCAVWIDDIPEQKAKTIKLHVRLLAWIDSTTHQAAVGKALLYLQKDKRSLQVRAGDKLIIPASWKEIVRSGNPGGFDYKAYCDRQEIYVSQWVPSSQWIQAGTVQHASLYFIQLGETMRNVLATFIPHPKHRAFAEALLVGYRKGLDAETYQDYAKTGLSHLIAISGMHIGMIYFSLLKCLQFIPFFRQHKKAAIPLALVGIWFFACITGLPASVLRSTIMFTLIGIGELGKRKMSIYNNLCSSAFILLMIHPSWLFDPGFQLSYLAVFSLAVLYKPIYHAFYSRNFFIDTLWQLTAASIAAQVFTFPVILYYFHQFPFLFIINNLVGIILTTVILYLEIVLLCCSVFTTFSQLLGKLISILIEVLNNFVHILGNMEGSRLQQVQISLSSCVLLYGLIIFFLVFIFHRRVGYLFLGGMCLCLFLFQLIRQKTASLHQHRIVFFNDRKRCHLGLIAGTNYHFYSEPNDSSSFQFVREPAIIYYGLKTSKPELMRKQQNDYYTLVQFGTKTVLILKRSAIRFRRKIKVDVVVLPIRMNSVMALDSLQASDWVMLGEPPLQKPNSTTNWPSHYHHLAKTGALELNF